MGFGTVLLQLVAGGISSGHYLFNRARIWRLRVIFIFMQGGDWVYEVSTVYGV
jgi:hypothetical protein